MRITHYSLLALLTCASGWGGGRCQRLSLLLSSGGSDEAPPLLDADEERSPLSEAGALPCASESPSPAHRARGLLLLGYRCTLHSEVVQLEHAHRWCTKPVQLTRCMICVRCLPYTLYPMPYALYPMYKFTAESNTGQEATEPRAGFPVPLPQKCAMP